MSHNRFFLEHVDEGADHVVLTGQEARHASAVLRLKAGDSVELRDGKGGGWIGAVSKVQAGAIHIRLTGTRRITTESPLALTLGLAYSRAEKMEQVLRQATEMGVDRFVVFRAERSQYALTEQQAGKRRDRWLRVAREALCQCGRAKVPEIVFLSHVNKFLEEVSGRKEEGLKSLSILALETEHDRSLVSVWQENPECNQMAVAVGPEGGWTRDEVDRFLRAGFLPVHLGPRVLRLETAAVAILTAAQLLWGDFGA